MMSKYSDDDGLESNSLREKFSIAKMILSSAVLSSLASLSFPIKESISMHYIGHMHDHYIFTALGFGYTWIGLWSFTLTFSIALGFSMLASQAYGARNYQKLGMFLHQILVLMGIILVIVLPCVSYSGGLLSYMIEDEKIVSNIILMCRYMIPSCIASCYFQVIRTYLLAMDVFDVPAYILLVSVFLQIPFCHVFVQDWDLGLEGVALATGLSDIISAVLIHIYFRKKNPCPEAEISFSKDSFIGFAKFSKDVLLHGMAIFLEWITFELTFFFVLLMNNYKIFAAHSSIINYIYIIQMLFDGVAVSASTYMSNAAGEGSVKRVKDFAKVATWIYIAFSTISVLITYPFRESIAYYYSEDDGVETYAQDMLAVYTVGIFFDIGSTLFSFMLRSLGCEKYVMVCFVLSYDVVGIGSSLYLGYYAGYEHFGVWGGLVLGFVTMFSLCMYKFATMNWDYQIKKVREDMREEEAMMSYTNLNMELSVKQVGI